MVFVDFVGYSFRSLVGRSLDIRTFLRRQQTREYIKLAGGGK